MDVNYRLFKDTSFALLIWYSQEGKDDEAKVFSSVATWDPVDNAVEIRKGKAEKPILILIGDDLERIMKVTDDMKEILLHCDYGIPLSMSDIKEDDIPCFEETGLKW